MLLVVALVLLVVGSVAFHFLSPWYLTPLASNWSTIDFTLDVTFVVCGFVFVVINLFMAYAVYRFRYDKNRRAEYQPENKKLEVWLTSSATVGRPLLPRGRHPAPSRTQPKRTGQAPTSRQRL